MRGCTSFFLPPAIVSREKISFRFAVAIFVKYLKSCLLVENRLASPRPAPRAGCRMEFSILKRRIGLINETTWLLETLFVTACGYRVAPETNKTCPRHGGYTYYIRGRLIFDLYYADATAILRSVGHLA